MPALTRRPVPLWLATCAAVAGGCATSLSSFQPAHVARAGDFQAEAGMDVSIPTGTIVETIDAARTLSRAAESRMLTDEEERRIFGAGVNLLLNPPAVVSHVALAYAPFERWDFGVRLSTGAWRLGGRRQLVQRESAGYDLTVGLGLQKFTADFPVDDVLGVLEVQDFVRWDLDLPVVFGTSGDWYRLWGGPRVLLSSFSTGLVLQLPSELDPKLASVSGNGAFLGAQGGVALGYKHLFVALELTVVRLFSGVTLEAAGLSTRVDLGGLIVYPGLALMGEF